MKTWMVLGMLTLAGAAQAAAPKKADDPAAAEKREQMDQRGQMMLTLQISEALQMDDAATIKLRQTITQWDAQRSPIRQQMLDQAQVLRRAAKGDTTAYGQVDSAIQKILDLRTQLHAVDQKLFQQLSQGQPPQKKAKLALTLARTLRGMGRGGGGGGGPRGEPDDGQ